MNSQTNKDSDNDFVVENISSSDVKVVGRDLVENTRIVNVDISSILSGVINPIAILFRSMKGQALRPSEYANAMFDTLWLSSYIVLAAIRAFGIRDIQSPQPIHFLIILFFVGSCFAWTTLTKHVMVQAQGSCGICQMRLLGQAYYCVGCNLPICTNCYDGEHKVCKICTPKFVTE